MKETFLLVGALLVLCCSLAVTADGVDINQAVAEFRTTFLRPPFDQYILGIQFTTLDAEREHNNDIVLSHDETWSSWCLDVTLGVNLPELPASIREALPPTFYEFRVFYNPASSSSDVDPQYPEDSQELSESSEGPVDCNMLALECPDGSYASRTSDCLFVCGAQPIGGLTYEQVDAVKQELLSAYDYAFTATIDTLYNKNAKLTAHESLNDYCIDVSLQYDDNTMYPAVYNGVRIFYYPNVCSAVLCPDGTLVGCNEVCPPQSASASSGSILVPVLAIIFVVVLSTCCCYLRGRRCRAKCAAQKNGFTALPTKSEDEAKYPSEQYAQLQQETPASPQMHPIPMMMPPMPMPVMMMAPPHPGMMMPPPPHPSMMMPPPPPMMPPMSPQMGYPPMPPMMHPNGSFPVMMQAPNGMWYPAPPHPEDA